jgi:methyl-accepting chemotaxis protein
LNCVGFSFGENMAKKFNNSLSNSLKGKIWLATTALAFFICTFGILSYLIISYLINDNFYAIFIPFLFLAMTVVAFGWWISNEIVNPVEKVLLFAKSLERGTSAAPPKTSGATETDELMETMFRLSQQAQKLVDAMDSVAQGNLDPTLTPNSNSDRITGTFQKLLAKVSESIHAKQELEKLQSIVQSLSEEISPLKKNNLALMVNSEIKETKTISETINHLTNELNEIASQVKAAVSQTQNSSGEIQKVLQTVIEQDEKRMQEMSHASVTLKQVPQMVQKISEELSQSAFSANQSIEKARHGENIAQANLTAVGQLRKNIQEALKRIQKLNECSQEVGKVAKTVEDLAHRTNMVALNASIQAADLNEEGRGFAVVSEEVERLAERANHTNKHISSLNKSIQAEINQVESSLETTVSEVANLSRFAIETGNSIEELERYVTNFLTLQEKMVGYTHERTEETEKAFQIFVDSIAEADQSVSELKESVKNVEKINHSMDRLQNSVSHLNSFSSLSDMNRSNFTFDDLPQNFDAAV